VAPQRGPSRRGWNASGKAKNSDIDGICRRRRHLQGERGGGTAKWMVAPRIDSEKYVSSYLLIFVSLFHFIINLPPIIFLSLFSAALTGSVVVVVVGKASGESGIAKWTDASRTRRGGNCISNRLIARRH